MEKYRNIVLITEWTLVLCLVGYVENTGACSPPVNGVYSFGRECQYMCHCHDNLQCDVDTGHCTDGCESGWYGPGCQFRDVAYGEHATHSSERLSTQTQANLANDNKVTTCSYTTHANSSTSEPWWKVWLPRQHMIKELTILTNDNGKDFFGKFTITVERVPEENKTSSYIPRSSQVCYQQYVKQSQAIEFHVICKKPLYGNQVRIRLDTIKSHLVICDIKINGGRNFAFHKLATAKSLNAMNNYLPENAVDGSVQSDKQVYCFMSTLGSDVWFQVDLGAMVYVTRIVLTKYSSDHLKAYQLQTSHDNTNWTIVHNDTSDSPRLDIDVDDVIRYIGIYTKKEIRMVLCELQAFGDCAYGYCGNNCSFECHCKTMEDRFTGKCISGCEGRWTGPDDTCVTESKQTSESGSDHTTGIVGGVLALVVVIVIVVAVYFNCRRRNKNLSPKHKTDNNAVFEDIDSPNADEAAVCDHDNAASNLLPEREDFFANTNETDKAEEKGTHEYYNAGSVVARKTPHAVTLTDFSAYVRHGLSNTDFLKQFEEIPYGLQQKFTTEAARSSENAGKNRYKDVYPYDHCRVILTQSLSRSTTDYINASHIKGYHKESAYIAAQGPTYQNVNEFWRMIWEKDVHLIAMVTNLTEETKMKCIKYWAPVKESVQYGDINIFTESENIFGDFDVRRFKVSQDDVSEKRDVIHFGYTAWPDKGVPSSTTSLLQFWQRVRKNDGNKTHPWLVHCSAGIGRTGTFIALDVLFDQGQDIGYVNVYQCVKDLRDQRVHMVQTKEQYQYLYLIVLDALVLPSYPVSMNEYELYYTKLLEVDQESGREKLLLEYKSLDNLTSVSDIIQDEDSTRDMYSCAKNESNRDKNRFSHILARDEYRPFLCTPVEGTTNYINAMYMPSYSDSHGFIITQTPLPVTAVDHCRLIVEQEVQVIVTFDEENEPENVGDYLPVTGTIELGPFAVSFVSEEEKAGYTVRKHTLLYNSKEFKLTQVMYKSWAPSNLCPDDRFQMLGSLHEVNRLQMSAENKPILAQCMNGAERSGILVALMNIIEHARIDGEVSIPNVIRYLRTRRPEIIPNYEQYKFCHDVFLGYVQSDLTYANM